MIYKIYKIALRECRILMINPVYLTCMIVFPVIVTFFFTTLMNEGQPQEMPVGVVDLDKTSTSRNLIRRLDGFQTSNVVAYYPNVNEARRAIQRNEIYAFLYIPNGTTSSLFASRRPKISLYYSNVSLTAGALLFKDLKTVALLGSAGVGQATMRARGFTDDQIKTFLQPIALDLHMINNPWANYNMYLSTMLIPGILMLFMFLITTYTLGTELKLKKSKNWFAMAGNNTIIALTGKLLPEFLVFLSIFYVYMYYLFGYLQFPHPGGVWMLMLLGLLAVLSSIGFGIFIFRLKEAHPGQMILEPLVFPELLQHDVHILPMILQQFPLPLMKLREMNEILMRAQIPVFYQFRDGNHLVNIAAELLIPLPFIEIRIIGRGSGQCQRLLRFQMLVEISQRFPPLFSQMVRLVKT